MFDNDVHYEYQCHTLGMGIWTENQNRISVIIRYKSLINNCHICVTFRYLTEIEYFEQSSNCSLRKQEAHRP